MKRLYESLAAKLTAVVLCVVLAAVLVASAVGTVALIVGGAFTDGGVSMRYDVMDNYLATQSQTAAWHYEIVANGEASSYYDRKLSSELTNYRYTVTDHDGNVLLASPAVGDVQHERVDTHSITLTDQPTVEEHVFLTSQERQLFLSKYLVQYASNHTTVAHELTEELTDSGEVRYRLRLERRTTEQRTIEVHSQLPAKLSVQDTISTRLYWIDRLLLARDWLLAAAVASLIGLIVLCIYLICAVGHKAGVEGIYLHWANRVPLDVYAAFLLVPAALPILIVDAVYSGWAQAVVLCVGAVWWFLLLLALVTSFAARAKAGAWWRNTLVFYLLRAVWRAVRWLWRGTGYLLRSLPLVWKTALAVAVTVMLSFITLLPSYGTDRLLLWLPLTLVLAVLVLTIAVALHRLQKGAQDLANGAMDSRVDTQYLYGELRRSADTLNRIGDGMTVAVDARLKSERMKTELITNVSHDIKTPLTSIINYVDLLKKEEPESETMQEYLDVLDRQSARLKKLIEDLVEASKASTGNLSVELVPCEVGILLTQMVGEYEERAAAQQLDLRLDQPEGPITILADGRHLSRVFDNLMNNILKYSQEGTRVYLSLHREGERAVITFRNISRSALNLSGDELMERFVRGDSSRNTEGSGLGLSIARSLTELQNGQMALAVDGDLFKVTLTFNIMK